MGVSGAGKTSVGQALASAIGGRFVDGDDFHPPANVDKMRRGLALDDDDRAAWLDRIAGFITDHDGTAPLVVACSALKRRYRRHLGRQGYRLVYLKGSPDVIATRMKNRQGHFMPAALLDSQFAALEEPQEAIVVDIDQPVAAIVARIVEALA